MMISVEVPENLADTTPITGGTWTEAFVVALRLYAEETGYTSKAYAGISISTSGRYITLPKRLAKHLGRDWPRSYEVRFQRQLALEGHIWDRLRAAQTGAPVPVQASAHIQPLHTVDPKSDWLDFTRRVIASDRVAARTKGLIPSLKQSAVLGSLCAALAKVPYVERDRMLGIADVPVDDTDRYIPARTVALVLARSSYSVCSAIQQHGLQRVGDHKAYFLVSEVRALRADLDSKPEPTPKAPRLTARDWMRVLDPKDAVLDDEVLP
jgi:hypothetical protein